MSEASTTAPARQSGTPAREYVVLQQESFEEGEGVYFVEVTRIESRNGRHALRKAFRELRDKSTVDGGIYKLDDATLVVVPVSHWNPLHVRAEAKDSYTVAVGDE